MKVKVLIFLSFVIASIAGYSQCQPVCVVSGSITPTGTLSVTGNWLRQDSATSEQNRLRSLLYYGGKSNANWLNDMWNDLESMNGKLGNIQSALQGTLTTVYAGTQTVNIGGTPTFSCVNCSGGGSSTVTVTNPFLKETTYRDSVHYSNVIANAINAGIQQGITLFARQTTQNFILAALTSDYGSGSYLRDTISGKHLSVANAMTFNDGVSNSGSVFKDVSDQSVFLDGISSSVFTDVNTQSAFTDADKQAYLNTLALGTENFEQRSGITTVTVDTIVQGGNVHTSLLSFDLSCANKSTTTDMVFTLFEKISGLTILTLHVPRMATAVGSPAQYTKSISRPIKWPNANIGSALFYTISGQASNVFYDFTFTYK